MKKGLLLLAPIASLVISGCVFHAGDKWDSDESHDRWEQRQKDNRLTLSNLNLGDSRSEVIKQMGEPDFSESFSQNGKSYQVYYYRTHRNKGDGKTSKDETTPVVFLDNNLIGWGERALGQATSQ